nr:hypothetical protein Iba_chr15cCG5730 [Ipomoea batatas]
MDDIGAVVSATLGDTGSVKVGTGRVSVKVGTGRISVASSGSPKKYYACKLTTRKVCRFDWVVAVSWTILEIQHCFSKSTWQQSHSLQADELPLYTARSAQSNKLNNFNNETKLRKFGNQEKTTHIPTKAIGAAAYNIIASTPKNILNSGVTTWGRTPFCLA